MPKTNIQQTRRIVYLILQHIRGFATVKEAEELDIWKARGEENVNLFNQLLDAGDRSRVLSDWNVSDTVISLGRVKARMKAERKAQQFKFWLKLTAAAIVLVTLGLTSWYYLNSSGNLTVKYAGDFAPGSNKAFITLPGGETIKLSERKAAVSVGNSGLTYTDGDTISTLLVAGATSGHGKMSLVTPAGGTYQVILADGSKIWLNAASSLKFPSSFKGSEDRRVQLTGEAYFDIAKDKKHPFVVESRGQQVRVLGTRFNVNSYHNEPVVKTTLLEGCVFVLSSDNLSVMLRPGQESSLGNTGGPMVNNVNAEEAIAWQTGYFRFNRETLESIMRKVTRWYDAEVVYKNESVKTVLFSGTITRFGKVSDLLQILELTEKVSFKIENKKIIVNQPKN